MAKRTLPEIDSGVTFGSLTTIAIDKDYRRCHWICECICGAVVRINESNLRRRRSRRCQCAFSSTAAARKTSHGMTDAPEYMVWSCLITRCTNTNSQDYQDYGGRGISVCDRWRDFSNFFGDMGPRPSTAHSIDRIKNELGYSKENCRWATPVEQATNKRNNRLITAHGRTLTLGQWARELGIPSNTLTTRLNQLALPAEEALFGKRRHKGHSGSRKRRQGPDGTPLVISICTKYDGSGAVAAEMSVVKLIEPVAPDSVPGHGMPPKSVKSR